LVALKETAGSVLQFALTICLVISFSSVASMTLLELLPRPARARLIATNLHAASVVLRAAELAQRAGLDPAHKPLGQPWLLLLHRRSVASWSASSASTSSAVFPVPESHPPVLVIWIARLIASVFILFLLEHSNKRGC